MFSVLLIIMYPGPCVVSARDLLHKLTIPALPPTVPHVHLMATQLGHLILSEHASYFLTFGPLFILSH